MRRLLGHAGAWIVWWVALFWFWLLLSGEWNRYEWIAGACAATVALAIAELARHVTGERMSLPLRWVARAASLPLMVFVDFAILAYALGRSLVRLSPVRGEFRANSLEPGLRGSDRAGIRAWIAYVATVSPNAYVVHVDEQAGHALVHDLVPYRASERPA